MEIYFKAGKMAIGHLYHSPLLKEESLCGSNPNYPQVSTVLRLNYEVVGSKNYTPFITAVCSFCARRGYYYEVLYAYDSLTKESIPMVMYSQANKDEIVNYLISKGYLWDA